MSKHTPGPWRIGDAGVSIFGPKVEVGLPVMIAKMRPADGKYHFNARLIAAAPDLLAIVEAISRHRANPIVLFPHMLRDIDAAIRKAKGE